MTKLTNTEAERWRKQLQPLQDVEAAHRNAWSMLNKLCQRRGAFTISVPPETDDTDIVLASALHQIPHLIAELRQAWDDKRAVERQLDDMLAQQAISKEGQ